MSLLTLSGPAIRFSNVSKTYNTTRVSFQALQNVSFETQQGDFFWHAGA